MTSKSKPFAEMGFLEQVFHILLCAAILPFYLTAFYTRSGIRAFIQRTQVTPLFIINRLYPFVILVVLLITLAINLAFRHEASTIFLWHLPPVAQNFIWFLIFILSLTFLGQIVAIPFLYLLNIFNKLRFADRGGSPNVWFVLSMFSMLGITFYLMRYLAQNYGFLNNDTFSTIRITIYDLTLLGIFITAAIGSDALLWLTALLDSPKIQNNFRHGQGGSAKWGGEYYLRKYAPIPNNDSAIHFGLAHWKDNPTWSKREIAIDNDAHLFTIACTGAGKARAMLIPNLLRLKIPVFVIDPKGELAAITAARRGKDRLPEVKNDRPAKYADSPIPSSARIDGSRSYVLDPFNQNPLYVSDRFNPLAELDPKSPTIREDIASIGEAIVLKDEGSKNAGFWYETSRSVIEGLIAHVITTEPPENRNLNRVYDLLVKGKGEFAGMKGFKALLDEMSVNREAGGRAMDAVTTVERSGSEASGNILTEALRHLDWLGSESMRKNLAASDFKLADLRNSLTTVYVVLPEQYMKTHARWLRLMTTITINKLSSLTPAPAFPKTLLILDELPTLGYLPKVESAFAMARGAGIKLWCIAQQISQVKEVYHNTDKLLGNATRQYFGVQDLNAANEICNTLGFYKDKNGMANRLLDPSEIIKELNQGSGRQILDPIDGVPMRLTLQNYDKKHSVFSKGINLEDVSDPHPTHG